MYYELKQSFIQIVRSFVGNFIIVESVRERESLNLGKSHSCVVFCIAFYYSRERERELTAKLLLNKGQSNSCVVFCIAFYYRRERERAYCQVASELGLIKFMCGVLYCILLW